MKYTFESDNDVWSALRREDPDVLRYIYHKYFRIWISWMVQRGGQQGDGEDVFQEALLVLVNKAKEPSFTLTARVSTLLMAICKRLWYKKIQKNAPFKTDEMNEETDREEEAEVNILEEHYKKEKQYELMYSALDQLGEPCASILKAYYISDKSMAQIAAEHKYSNADNAKNQKYKCLNRLKKLFFQAAEKEEKINKLFI